jgi:dihydroorotate dehydrogenase
MNAVIDRSGRAFRAFERFGYGYVEIGPVALDDSMEHGQSSVDLIARALTGPKGLASIKEVVAELQQQPPRLDVRRLVRIGPGDEGKLTRALEALAPYADGFLVGQNHAATAAKIGKPWGLVGRLSAIPSLADLQGAPLVVVDPDHGVWSPTDRKPGLETVAALRKRFPHVAILYAAGGIESPGDAQSFRDAGADLISLSHGFVFTGPGTPKRINEGLAAMLPPKSDIAESAPDTLVESARYAWFWCLALGIAMASGSLLAGFFALTRVLLPYDEVAAGITRAQIEALNPKLLYFMAHDRFTLAGTMLSLGLLYAGLALFGVRLGRLWAQEAVVFSAFAGFLTFFSFLAYGYFDPFHAFVAASMLPIAIQCAVGKPSALSNASGPDLDNDASWRRACVGQLCWIVQSIGLLLAGAIIMSIGSARVFVDSDLGFLGSTHDAMRMLHPNLVPLIAHDRATFGGMLLATGIAVLLATLWGFRRGERWLWWTVGIAGLPAYFAALWIHQDIAYTDPLHLSPVFIGLALHIAGWTLSAGYLKSDKE